MYSRNPLPAEGHQLSEYIGEAVLEENEEDDEPYNDDGHEEIFDIDDGAS